MDQNLLHLDFKPGKGEVLRAVPEIHKTYQVSFNIIMKSLNNANSFFSVFRIANNEGIVIYIKVLQNWSVS